MTPGRGKWRLALAATGVVFGDIGPSPLYAFRESFIGRHRLPVDPPHVLAVLSMLFWALILVVTVKYVSVTMRADNRGEGGSFALLALIQRITPKSPLLPAIAAAALLATALFYGDWAPTWLWVPMPLGSSSAAPVTSPGPSWANNLCIRGTVGLLMAKL